MTENLAIRVKEECRHGSPPDRATAQRAPLGNDVRWQVRVYYRCDEGCFESGVFDRKPGRILFGEDGEIQVPE